MFSSSPFQTNSALTCQTWEYYNLAMTLGGRMPALQPNRRTRRRSRRKRRDSLYSDQFRTCFEAFAGMYRFTRYTTHYKVQGSPSINTDIWLHLSPCQAVEQGSGMLSVLLSRQAYSQAQPGPYIKQGHNTHHAMPCHIIRKSAHISQFGRFSANSARDAFDQMDTGRSTNVQQSSRYLCLNHLEPCSFQRVQSGSVYMDVQQFTIPDQFCIDVPNLGVLQPCHHFGWSHACMAAKQEDEEAEQKEEEGQFVQRLVQNLF